MVAMIGIGLVVGFNRPWTDEQCGLAAVNDFAAVVAKVSLGCIIGAIAGLIGSVRRGAVVGALIGGLASACLGSPISITSNSVAARFGIGAAVGIFIGGLAGLAGKTTPSEDRFASK